MLFAVKIEKVRSTSLGLRGEETEPFEFRCGSFDAVDVREVTYDEKSFLAGFLFQLSNGSLRFRFRASEHVDFGVVL